MEKKRKSHNDKGSFDESSTKKKRVYGKSKRKFVVSSSSNEEDPELEDLYNEIDNIGGANFVDELLIDVTPSMHDVDFVE